MLNQKSEAVKLLDNPEFKAAIEIMVENKVEKIWLLTTRPWPIFGAIGGVLLLIIGWFIVDKLSWLVENITINNQQTSLARKEILEVSNRVNTIGTYLGISFDQVTNNNSGKILTIINEN